MYKYIPQKKRSSLRIKLGVLFYSTLRFFFWIKNSKNFATLKKSKKFLHRNSIKNSLTENTKETFSYSAFCDSSELYRNLSKEDSILQDAKVTNLKIAVNYVNGVILLPSKTFSYWKLLGNPTRLKGYQKGMMLVNGKPQAKTAGGLCALSNLIYWITLHTPLTVTERFRHSYDVFPDSNRKRPFGSGATCVYNYRDLMIKNETDNIYKLEVKIENDKLVAEWKTVHRQKEQYIVFEKDPHITQEAAGVFVRHNKIFRKNLLTLEEQFITENHALMMYRPFIEDISNK